MKLKELITILEDYCERYGDEEVRYFVDEYEGDIQSVYLCREFLGKENWVELSNVKL